MSGTQPEFDNAIVRSILVTVLRFQQQRIVLEQSFGPRINVLANSLENEIQNLWRQMARLQSFNRTGVSADFDTPGYLSITLPAASGRPVYFPFHLMPAAPEFPVLDEVIAVADRVVLNRVQGQETAVCLSGSTVVLKDVIRVGDIDFCEYIPAHVPASALAKAFRDQVVATDPRYCTISIRMRKSTKAVDEQNYCEIRTGEQFSDQQLDLVSKLVGSGRNIKTTHLVGTQFAGVTEATNWAIIFQPPLEHDPIAGLSFAHQEAALGTFARRPLHTVEALAAYLNFLRADMQKHIQSNPVKAVKRAIAWLRLFGHDDLRLELLQVAHSFRALECAALLSKIKLLDQYRRMKNLRPEIVKLVDALAEEIQEQGDQLATGEGDLKTFLEDRIAAFGKSLLGAGIPNPANPSLLSRILSLAE
jgi:hypothetical protein